MTTIQIIHLISNCPELYKVIWEDMYYGERTVKDVSSMFIRSMLVGDSLAKNYSR